MIGRFACPPCASIFVVEQRLWQEKNVVPLNVTGNKNHCGDFIALHKFKQPKDPVNILHWLSKIVESKNV